MIFSKQTESRSMRVTTLILAGALCAVLLDLERVVPGAPETTSDSEPIPIGEINSRRVLGRLSPTDH